MALACRPPQIGIVAELQNLAASAGFDPPPRLIDSSLGQVREFAAVGAFSDYWLPDVTDQADVSLGVHLRYRVDDTRPRLFQMTYGVDGNDGHFTVIWNRAMVASRR
ncbi:MAG TPA: hypothetical protein VKY22_18410 [Bradyrhizobium sp.]|nr:hypothetical protein [Bradyrhizobium sp.]